MAGLHVSAGGNLYVSAGGNLLAESRDMSRLSTSLTFLLREPDGEVFQDCAEMNLRDLQGRSDVLELLAFLTGDAVVGEQHEIGRAHNLLLARFVERLRRSSEIGQDFVARI